MTGSGSYGNGGAMRVAPIALFCHAKPVDLVIELARMSTVPTHTHPDGINGAILQALAVHAAFQLNPNEPLDVHQFLENLEAKIQKIEVADDEYAISFQPSLIRYTIRLFLLFSLGLSSTPTRYVTQLQKIGKLLRKSPSEVEVVNSLGNEVAALFSVPTAIYCFLRAFSDIPGMEVCNTQDIVKEM